VGKSIRAGSSSGTFSLPFVSAAATTVVGFGFFMPSANTPAFQFYGDNGTVMHHQITFAADQRVQLRRSATTVATSVGVPISLSTWHYMELKMTVADAGGIGIVKIDGVEHINFTGDTKNGGTAASLDRLNVDLAATNTAIDDLYILDGTGSAPYNDFIGEKVIKAKRPVGNGAASAFTGSDGDSTDNYLLVDEDPVNITDYVASNTAGQQDLYDLSAATGLASVDAVQVAFYASKSDSGSRSLKALQRSSGGNVVASTAIPLSTSWAALQGSVRTVNPDGAAWTPANVNTIQAGIETA
jgi:hypothetical protein